MAIAPRLIVEHATDSPAEDAMAAGALAGFLKQRGVAEIDFVRLRSAGRDFAALGAQEHATAYGDLVANGMYWAERELGRDLGPESNCLVEDLRRDRPCVVAVNPVLLDDVDLAGITGQAGTMHIVASYPSGSAELVLRETVSQQVIGRIIRDPYGRPQLRMTAPEALLKHFGVDGERLCSPPRVAQAEGPNILVVGEASYHRAVYPALIAALGDAADQLCLIPNIVFVSPRGVHAADWPELLAGAHGVLLPGGPDMTQTAGQVDAAAAALDARVPTLGICLGMQTMTTAFARRRGGMPRASLEEIDPQADPQAFVRLRSATGEELHRIGARELKLGPQSRLADLMGTDTMTERLHHRYHLAPDLRPALVKAGLRLAASGRERIVDGIEAPDHPFFVGLQCHIELSIRGTDQPHPVLLAFLGAASARSTRTDEPFALLNKKDES